MDEDNIISNKRIAKNTILLYCRTLITMVIALYTSRVVLNALGVEDYGIYNVVGGVVAMFSVFSASLSSSISRFITFELANGDIEKLKRIFSTSINIQIGISLFILILGETLGLWFLNTTLNISADRIVAANWVFQCSILSFIVNLISIPYNACIIAHERMNTFAYISIFEAGLKLGVAFLLLLSPFDKLIVYSILLLCVALLIRLIYGVYCRKHFYECHYVRCFDRPVFKEMTGFAGWNFFGNTAYILNVQGVDMLINIFFGVSLNAARGITTQVQNAVMQFVNNFTVAINPQITKSYAIGDRLNMFNLICRGARFSYFLLLIFVIPIVCEADYILKLWLKTVPEYTTRFLQLTLFGALMTILGNSMLTGISATGDIKKYQIWVTIVGCLVFPLTWCAFKLGMSPEITYIIYILVYFLLIFVRLIIIHEKLNFPMVLFLKDVICRIGIVTILSFVIPILLVITLDEGFYRFIIVCISSITFTMGFIVLLGLQKTERKSIFRKVKLFLSKKR